MFGTHRTSLRQLARIQKSRSGTTFKARKRGDAGLHGEDSGIPRLKSWEVQPIICPYTALLDIFWQQIDPTDPGWQFYDRGESYRTAIFYHDEAQRQLAEASKKALAESGRFDKPIATLILPASAFYPAEEYHQDYHKKNPLRYEAYRAGSGRQAFIERYWKKSAEDDLRRRLTPLQYDVTQNAATEPPFRNEYWDHREEGIHVDIASGAFVQLARQVRLRLRLAQLHQADIGVSHKGSRGPKPWHAPN